MLPLFPLTTDELTPQHLSSCYSGHSSWTPVLGIEFSSNTSVLKLTPMSINSSWFNRFITLAPHINTTHLKSSRRSTLRLLTLLKLYNTWKNVQPCPAHLHQNNNLIGHLCKQLLMTHFYISCLEATSSGCSSYYSSKEGSSANLSTCCVGKLCHMISSFKHSWV